MLSFISASLSLYTESPVEVGSGTSSLAITFSDCGQGAHSVVKSVTPNVLPLGGTTSFTGAGTNTGEISSASWTMKMTGVAGVTLLSCKGDDATQAASCPIGLGPIKIGTAAFGGLKFPYESGDISLDNIVSITLPKGLPSFALTTTTTLISTAQDGKEAFCVKIMSAPSDMAETVESLAAAIVATKPALPAPLPVPAFEGMAYPSSHADASSLAITFSDCGQGAHSVVKSVTPNLLPLGGTTSFTGAGTNTGEISSASWTMKMTGVAGVTLLSCKGDDATQAASCPIGLGPIKIGTAAFGGLKFPYESGDISLDNIVSITLPKGLPSFALNTVTTLISTAQDGKEAFCVKIMSAPSYY